MEKFMYFASLMNIPIPPRETYKKLLLAKTSEFIERLRWKVFFKLHPEAKKSDVPDTFGFRTSKAAPQSKEIAEFEKGLINLVTNVKFKNSPKSSFQKELQNKVAEIKSSNKVFLLADKTTNIYKVDPEEYNKLLSENITKDYRKSSDQDVKAVNKEAKEIAEKLKIADRVEMHGESSAYITIKDHKDNFQDNPKCRLINPAKSEIGKISKQILEKLNMEIREKTNLKQWRSTNNALDFFNKLEDKQHLKFLQLDIVEFYPSISSELLDNAIMFAEDTLKRKIDSTSKRIILNSRKAFLFTQTGEQNIPWVKKLREDFDVTMGAPDGAELCEFVGLYLLNEVKEEIPDINLGLYRDDGLATYRNLSGRRQEKIRQNLHQIFNRNGLRITIEADLTTVNFLDVTFDLKDNSYKPYKKPNDKPLYVHVKSNHPPNVLKEIPKSINNRLRKISSNKEAFDNAKDEYQKALENSGYSHVLCYEINETVPKTVYQSDNSQLSQGAFISQTVPKTVYQSDHSQPSQDAFISQTVQKAAYQSDHSQLSQDAFVSQPVTSQDVEHGPCGGRPATRQHDDNDACGSQQATKRHDDHGACVCRPVTRQYSGRTVTHMHDGRGACSGQQTTRHHDDHGAGTSRPVTRQKVNRDACSSHSATRQHGDYESSIDRPVTRQQSYRDACNSRPSTRQHGDYDAGINRPVTRQQVNLDACNSQPTTQHQNGKDAKKKRDIIWYNPPYNIEVATNIGKEFLLLIEKHFPKDHKLRKCINRNCVKLSYSCTKNMKSIIQSHNKKITTNTQTNPATPESTCNCQQRQNCPLDGHCISGPIVYKATIKDRQENEHTYIGSTNNFKDRYRNHTKSFRHESYKRETTLSGFIWDNALEGEPDIRWEILRKTQVYKKGQRYCDLCLSEKLCITEELKRRQRCLNKRSDLTNRCIHRALYRLTRA